MQKSELRIWAKNIRKELDTQSISSARCQKIRATGLYKEAEHIMIFYPLPNEINLLPLLDDNKTFYLPCVNGDEIYACPYKKGDKLICSNLKIMEPTTAPITPNILDIIFTPALCVDKNFYRLGYGGGFYDRFLKNIKSKTKSICVIPNELIIEQLPVEDYDIRCDGIITQKKASFQRG